MVTKTLVKRNTTPWLKPFEFKKGQSGNPKGREPGHKYSLRAVVRGALLRGGYKLAIKKMRDRGVDIHDGTHGDVIAAVLLWKAENGDMDAIKEVIRLTEKPFSNQLGPDDPDFDPEDNSITVTVNVIKNTQNIIDVKSKEIKE